MFIAGVDTGETNGLVIVNQLGDVILHRAHRDLDQVLIVLTQYINIVVVLERAPKTQIEYMVAKEALEAYGFSILEVSPGEWKPNPHCRTPKDEHPDWTQHERDALSLTKYYQLTQKSATPNRRTK